MNQHPTDAKASQSGATALRFDVIAGLTAAAVVLPKAMAYASVAGLPIAVGLYTAFIPMVIYALLGSSRVLSVSSTTTLGILTGSELGTVVPADNKWFTRVVVGAAVIEALDSLNLKYPKVSESKLKELAGAKRALQAGK